jgi:hypothetical protein
MQYSRVASRCQGLQKALFRVQTGLGLCLKNAANDEDHGGGGGGGGGEERWWW